MLVKTAPARVKTVGTDDDPGTFEALVSVFGNVDSYGDRVVKGAFAESLEQWKSSGNPIPILYSHNSYDPDYNIGHVLEAAETDEGLLVKGALDVDAETGKAKQVHRLLTTKRVTQFSFAYDVLDGKAVTEDQEYVYELTRLKLYEVGPCLIGANPETRLVGAKHDGGEVQAAAARSLHRLSAELKAGRTLSAENEKRIRSAVDALAEVLGSLTETSSTGDSTGDDAGKAAVADALKSVSGTSEALERELAQLSG